MERKMRKSVFEEKKKKNSAKLCRVQGVGKKRVKDFYFFGIKKNGFIQ